MKRKSNTIRSAGSEEKMERKRISLNNETKKKKKTVLSKQGHKQTKRNQPAEIFKEETLIISAGDWFGERKPSKSCGRINHRWRAWCALLLKK